MQSNLLQRLELSENQFKVYKTLLQYKNLNASEISKKTNINRRNIYDILKILLRKGYIQETKISQITIYNANDPKILKEKFTEQHQELKALAHSLSQHFATLEPTEKIISFTGKEGLNSAIELCLDESGDSVYEYHGPKELYKTVLNKDSAIKTKFISTPDTHSFILVFQKYICLVSNVLDQEMEVLLINNEQTIEDTKAIFI